MTVTTTTTRLEYSGNGATTSFQYTFKILTDEDLAVYVITAGVATLQTLNDDYTVTGEGTASGGNVVFATAPANSTTVLIVRNQPMTQLTSYQENDPFPADTHEEAIDNLQMQIQTINDKLSRAVLLPVNTSLLNTEFPDGEDSGGAFIKWNTDGDGLEALEIDSLSGTFADVVQDTTPQLGGDLDCNGKDIKVTGGTTTINESTDSNEYLSFNKAASAVNYLELSNSATGVSPALTAKGDDTDVGTRWIMKGAGVLALTGPMTISSTLAVTGNTTITGTLTGSSTITGAGAVIVSGTSSAGGYIQLGEDTDNGSNYVRLQSPASLAGNLTFILPSTDSAGTLVSDGSGNLSISTSNEAMVLISSQTASSSATIAFTGLSSTYSRYVVEILDVVPASDNVTLTMVVGTGGTPTYQTGASDYAYGVHYHGADGTSGNVNNSTGASSMGLLPVNGTGTGENASGIIHIYNPSQTSKYHLFRSEFTIYNANPGLFIYTGCGMYISSTAVTAVRLSMTSGNIASGTFKLYGIRAS